MTKFDLSTGNNPSTWDSLLIRDNLSDTGVVPSPGYAYHSCDIIPHTQVLDPTTFASAKSYQTNPGQAIKGGNFNYFYIRAKNMNTTGAVGGQVQLFWTKSSLLMNVKEWVGQPLPIINPSGPTGPKQFIGTFPSIEKNSVGVASTFRWDTPNIPSGADYHYCLVAVAFPDNKPFTLPTSDFPTATQFVSWVKNNQNVSWRNLQIIDTAKSDYHRFDTFHNSFSNPYSCVFTVTVKNGTLPNNTVVKLKCDPLGVNKSFTVGTDTPPFTVTSTKKCPPGFSGGVETSVILPKNTNWTSGTIIETSAKVVPPTTEYGEEHMWMGTSWSDVAVDPRNLGLEKNALLLHVGNSSVMAI